jgi:hypothetical protein
MIRIFLFACAFCILSHVLAADPPADFGASVSIDPTGSIDSDQSKASVSTTSSSGRDNRQARLRHRLNVILESNFDFIDPHNTGHLSSDGLKQYVSRVKLIEPLVQVTAPS